MPNSRLDPAEIDRYVDGLRPEFEKTLRELVEIPTVSMEPERKQAMQAGAAYPLLKEMMAFGGVSPTSIVNEMKGLLGSGDSTPAVAEPTADAAPASAANGPASVQPLELVPIFDEDEPTTGPVPTGTSGPPHLPTGVASAG